MSPSRPLSQSSPHPPTICVVHEKENRRKCTIESLRGRDDFTFVKFPLRRPVDAIGYLRLGMGGPVLGEADADRGLLVLDATWRLAGKMEAEFAGVPVRSLPPWKTAYPRVSKLFEDPGGGLATVEAIWLAHHLLSRDTAGLLDAYRWADEFLRLNGVTNL